jgi:hypothetical protein
VSWLGKITWFLCIRFFQRRVMTGQFVKGRLAAKAPAGTAAVRFEVLLAAAGLETGSIVVDDAKLVIAD